mmetsp:Transcript_39773/g.78397  ORF Transcript_39773/g.78397 Transcript_39773/m.78397 type:complete len:264 (-) Transcript_39773:754-1545(-)
MLHTDVLRHRVASPRSAPKGQRGGQTEVEHVSDGTLGCRHVDQNAPCSHQIVENRHPIRPRGVRVEDGGVSRAPEGNQSFGDLQGVLEVPRLVHSQNRRELLEREGLVRPDLFHLCDEDLSVGRTVGDSCHLGDLRCRLPHDGSVQVVVDDHQFCQFRLSVSLHEHSPSSLKLPHGLVVHLTADDDRLLACTDHSIVECLRDEHRADGHLQVCRLVNQDRRVPRTHTDRWFSRRVRSAHHPGAACGQNQIDLRVSHQGCRQGS